jgi:hypothetical protein
VQSRNDAGLSPSLARTRRIIVLLAPGMAVGSVTE